MYTLRTHPIVSVLAALIVLLMLSGAAYTLGRSLSYISSAGFVEQDSTLRVLEIPFTIERDNIG